MIDGVKYPLKASVDAFFICFQGGECMKTVLLVSSSVKFFGQIKSVADFSDCELLRATGMNEAKKYLLVGGVEAAVINCPLSDGFGFDTAVSVAENYGISILLFVKNDLAQSVREKIGDNPNVTVISKPADGETVKAAVNALKENLPQNPPVKKEESDSALAELKLISRAKILLMRQFSMNEAQAHRYLEKRAMDTGRTKKAIAQGIITAYRN